MFGSDNQAPAHPLVIEAILAANQDRAGSYGVDDWSAQALEALKRVFETEDLDMYLVGTGSAANGLALSVLCPPWGAVLALGDAHIVMDEGGGPEHFTSGARMICLGHRDVRLSSSHLEAAAVRFAPSNVQCPQPRAVSISNLSENGLTYTPTDIGALSQVCKANGWGLHMDGARFANAVAFSGASPADLTWRSGVDALSLGLTKNGAVGAEALILFGKARDGAAPYLRKRAGHLFSKQRYLAAQVFAMLSDGLWLTLSTQANAMAKTLGHILVQYSCKLAFEVQGNEVFAYLSDTQANGLARANIGFYPWAPAGVGVYRFVTCWQTSEADVSAVASALALVSADI